MTQPQNESIALLLRQMRDQLQDLREDNVTLRAELRDLRAENERIRTRAQTTPTIGHREDVIWPEDEFNPPTIAPSSSRLGDSVTQTANGWEREGRTRKATSVDGVYSRRVPGKPESNIYGRGLEPAELRGRELSPPVGRAVGAPAIDLGYVNSVSPDELDVLPYGLIVLDANGDVLFYNETESRLAGYDVEAVTGKNFFQDVAPCTRVKEFQGRFDEFVDGKLGRVAFFDFVFYFSHGTQKVLIGLSHGRSRGHYNVMMMRT